MAALTLSEKLDQLGNRYEEMTQQLSTAEAVSDSARFQKLAKQHSELAEIVNKHREFKQIEKDLAGAHVMVLENEDPEMKQLAHDEEKQLIERREIVDVQPPDRQRTLAGRRQARDDARSSRRPHRIRGTGVPTRGHGGHPAQGAGRARHRAR